MMNDTTASRFSDKISGENLPGFSGWSISTNISDGGQVTARLQLTIDNDESTNSIFAIRLKKDINSDMKVTVSSSSSKVR